MTTLTLLFWIGVLIVLYTYIGYGIVLWIFVKIKHIFCPKRALLMPEPLPEVTLLIAAYNEQDVVKEKMANCLALDYPAHLLKITWVTDGSTDRTGELLGQYPEVRLLHDPQRAGKTAALNRAMELIDSPIVICTDANTMLNTEAVSEIVRCFADPNVGCVAGEKRVATQGSSKAGAAATEGLYWRYESKLKELDFELYTAVGAAGELFAFRRPLYLQQSSDTLLDDFMISMQIAQRGYKIAYCKAAYALETPSANMAEEGKRKKRIAAGGLQSIWRLRALLWPLKRPILWFQYISHRVLRWTITPIVLVALLPINIALLFSPQQDLFICTLALQLCFYAAATLGWALESRGRRQKLLFVPYYFLFMNLNVFRGVQYLITHRGRGAWEKAKRA